MPAFAYQSFESTSSKTHDVKAIFQQRFTRGTNERVTGAGVEALVPPVNPAMPSAIYSGPAQKLPIEKIQQGGNPTIAFIQQHIAHMFRNGFSSMGENLCAFMCGELDVTGSDFDPMRAFPNLNAHVSAADKNNQSFTGFVAKSSVGVVKPIASGPSFYAFDIHGMSVAFVHVPNSIRSDANGAFAFYSGIQAALTTANAPGIDIVIGDTNQQNPDFTRECLDRLNIGNFANATSGSGVSPVDNYLHTSKGTNSAGDKMYDVCVYNSHRIGLDKIEYLSQSASGTTVTDHMGIIVKAHKK